MKTGRGGVEYEDLTLGEGSAVAPGCMVKVVYDLLLNRGETIQKNQTCSFRLGERRVIAGLEYGVEGMRVGGTRRLRVGPHLGYRDEGVPGVVPANAVLEFHLTLLAVAPEIERDATLPTHALLRPAITADAAALCAIYNPYVLETVITFEQSPVSESEMTQRIREYTVQYPWLVAEVEGKVAAYAYATRWRTRAAYDRTLESTVYVDKAHTGRGIAKPLYLQLLRELKSRGVHAVVGCIALPNDASVALHEKCGFVKVAHFPQVGRKFERWVDVGFWQATLTPDTP
jgi:phosphinothricin acetyltransferase